MEQNELKNMNETELVALGAEELAAAVIDLQAMVEELTAKLKASEERADNYSRWYSDQIKETSKANEKLNSLKGIVAVL